VQGPPAPKFATNLALVTPTTLPIPHGLGTEDVLVTLYNMDTGVVEPLGGSVFQALTILNVNTVQLTIGVAGNYRVVVFA
jgi:hypothetical protein